MIYTLEKRVPQFKGNHWIADNATLIGSVTLGVDVSVWYQCVLRGDNDDILIGDGSNVQDGSVLHTDPGLKLVVGQHCTIGHQVILHGCQVGDNTVVGMKSVILNRARIGRNSIVGANSLVTEGKEFPEGSLILGAPAKVVRPLTPQEIQMNALNAQHYVHNMRRYQSQLQPYSAG